MSTFATDTAYTDTSRGLFRRVVRALQTAGERRAKAELQRHFELMSDQSLAEYGLKRTDLRAKIANGTLWQHL
jgi:hypothetical protein